MGKTSIASRFVDDNFAQAYKQTIGLDFFLKEITLREKMKVALQLWDIGGQTIGGKMINNYIYGAKAVVLCYDITNNESFENLEDWYRKVRQTFGKKELPLCVLMGNKSDLNHLRIVREAKAERFAAENKFLEYKVSAKSGDGVNKAFQAIAASLTGVILSRAETDSHTTVVAASITQYRQHDESVEGGTVPEYTKKKSNCAIS